MNHYLLLNNILIILCGLTGSIILAVSVNPIFESIKTFFKALSTVINFNAEHENDQIAINGIDENFDNFSFKKASINIYIGLGYILLSYLLQIFPLIFKVS